VLRNHPLARLLPRLVYQLVPAVLVTAVGVLLLSNFTRVPATPPAALPVETAISTEAVFRIVPRETVEALAGGDAKRAAAASQKPPAAPPARKPANEPAAPRQAASAPAPLPIVQIPHEPQPVATADSDNAVVSKLRSASTAVQRIPQWAARSVAGWFAAEAPPRPPASVPAQAAM
jgi:hypothetical protein